MSIRAGKWPVYRTTVRNYVKTNILRALAASLTCLLFFYAPTGAGLKAQDINSIKLAPIQKARDIRTLKVLDSVRVFFPVSKSNFVESFEQNGERLRDVGSRMKEVQKNERMRIDRIIILASSSPEGSIDFNERLARERARSIADFLHKEYRFDDSIVEVNYHLVDWERFLSLVEEDRNVPDRDRVLEIIRDEDLASLRKMQGSRTWNYLLKHQYPALRSTFAVFEYTVMLPDLEPEPEPEPEPEVIPEPAAPVELPEPVPEPEPLHGFDVQSTYTEEVFEAKEYVFHERYLKTNMLVLPMLVPNLGFEYLFENHWSFSNIFYYTALDWFDIETKFRVLGLQSELRYWFRYDMMGPFVAAHATFGYYNIAWGGDYRYQDHNRSTPTFGGGVNLGWKIPLFDKEDTPWGVEFTLGAGVLPLHYDIYYNVYNGRKAGEDTKTYFGIDNASITLSYRIGRKMRERRVRK